MGPIFFTLAYSPKGLLALLHLNLQGVTEVDTDPKGKFVSFMVTLSNDRVLWVDAPSGNSTKKQLDRRRYLEWLQNKDIKNKVKGNENKIILRDVNCTLCKMERDGGNTDFTDAVSIMLCQKSSWVMGSWVYGEGRT